MDLLSFLTVYLNNIATVLLFVSGLFFTFKLRFFQFTGFFEIYKKTVGSLVKKNADKESFRLFTASLAGAAGVGNIVGVSSAIFIGGPGAVFWMWVAAFLGMATKFAETSLSLHNKSSKNGYNASPMKYIEKAGGKKLPAVFAFLGVVVSLLMGNMIQSRALAESVYDVFGVSHIISGVFVFLTMAAIIFGGFKRIVTFAERVVPFMTILYIMLCVIVIIIDKHRIIQSIIDIFIYAFKPISAVGGFAGAGIAKALRSGVSKGIFSNEAGLGSAGLAYGNSEKNSPEEQGFWGAFDVFADTIFISSFSALALLSSGVWVENGSVVSIFSSHLGAFGSVSGVVCVVLFAIASMITWEYYGESCFVYLTNGRFINAFRVIFLLLAAVGAIISTEILWSLAEISNALMMSVNTFAVGKLTLNGEIKIKRPVNNGNVFLAEKKRR